MTKEKRLQKALTDEKYKCRLVKSKKNWVIKGMLFSTLLVGGMSIQTSVYAEEWSANAPESIQIESGATSYTLKEGDTLWAISQVTNIKVETLAEINNIDLSSGEQYNLEIGRVIYFDGNHVTILDKDGNLVADKVLDDNDKVDSSKPFAGQSSDIPKNPVTTDSNGNVKTQENTNLNQNSSSKNNLTNNGNKSNSNQQSSDKNGNSTGQGNGSTNKPNENKPTNSEKPNVPEEKPVNPEKPTEKEFAVSVIHKDNEGNILEKEADIKIKEGESYIAKAKGFDNYTLEGQPTQTIKVDSDKVITFIYRKNETPNPEEKFEITIKYVDENNQEIAETYNVKVENGQEYTATAKTIEGYSLFGEATQSITVSKNEIIIFKYTKNTNPVEKFTITIKYEDEARNEISSSETQEIEKGQIFTAQGKDITGYTLIGDNTQSIMVTGDKTIIFKYSRNEEPIIKYPITVEYKDEDGNLLASDSPIEIESGKSFTAAAKTISGYILQGENTQTITVNRAETITFVYKKDEAPIVVDKSDLENLINSVKDTEKGNFTNESFSDFEIALTNANLILNNEGATQQQVNQAKTDLQIAFDKLEVKEYTVTVSYVDTEGTVLDSTNATVKDGESYTANAKTIEGYTLQGADSQTITVNSDTTIKFTYSKDEVVTPPEANVSEVEQAIASQALALINQHRNNNGLISLNNQSALQQGADVRSNEIFTLYEHTRPNGEDGADAPYDYGYDQVVFAENIGMYNNPSSLEWLAQNGASIVVSAWINSSGHNANLLLDGLNEGSVGIHLEQQSNGKYTMGSVFLGAKNYSLPTKNRSTRESNEQTELIYNIQKNTVEEKLSKVTTVEVEEVESTVEISDVVDGAELVKTTEESSEIMEQKVEETIDDGVKEETEEQMQSVPVNKKELIETYNTALSLEESNFSVHSWSVLMIKLADAKYVYDNPDVNQLDIDNAVLALQQAINNLV